MIPIRYILQRTSNGLCLVAEIKLDADEIKRIKTKLVLGMDVTGIYETSVYWYTNKGYPPAPPTVRNPEQVKASPIHPRHAYNIELNTSAMLEWVFEISVFDNPDGK